MDIPETVSLLKAPCFISRHVDLFLGNDLEISNNTTTVNRQRPVKRGAVFSTRSVRRCYKQSQLAVAVF
jgi:hypothetical protein